LHTESLRSNDSVLSPEEVLERYSLTVCRLAFARVKNPRAVQKSLVGDPGMGAETWVREDGRDRPSVVMYRDSFSVAMLAFIAESSSQFIVNPMWDFSVNMELLKKEKPDYLIIEKVERESRGFSGVLR